MWQKILSALGFILVLLAMAVGGAFGKIIGKVAFGPSTSTPKRMEQELLEGLQKAARQINERGPVTVNKDTRMDGASVGPGIRMTYHYTFPNLTSRDIDEEWLRTNLFPQVRSGVCADHDMAPSLKYGAAYVYSYSGSDGVRIADFQVLENDCRLASLTDARSPAAVDERVPWNGPLAEPPKGLEKVWEESRDEINNAAGLLMLRFPFLDTRGASGNNVVLNEVLSKRDGYIRAGLSPPVAISRAAEDVAGPYNDKMLHESFKKWQATQPQLDR